MVRFEETVKLDEFELEIIQELLKAEYKRVMELPRHSGDEYYVNNRLYNLGTATGKVIKAYDRTQTNRMIFQERFADWTVPEVEETDEGDADEE